MSNSDLITFGETMGLIMPVGSKGLEFAPQLQRSFGGAESNVAICAARMGVRVSWISCLGNDPFGRMIMKTLRGEGVDVSGVQMTDGAPTGMMLRESTGGKTSVYYYRKHSAASKMNASHIPDEAIRQARILHVSGITAAISPSCREALYHAVRLAKQHGVKVCFDPNLRLKLWSLQEAREVLLDLAAQADYFLPGLDELKLLYDTDDEQVIWDRLEQLSAVSVVKGGDRCTYLLEQGKREQVPYVQVERVIDPIGAGDAFCAGFISALLEGQTHYEAVARGNLLGAMIIQMEGDWEAAPTRREVEVVLQQQMHVER